MMLHPATASRRALAARTTPRLCHALVPALRMCEMSTRTSFGKRVDGHGGCNTIALTPCWNVLRVFCLFDVRQIWFDHLVSVIVPVEMGLLVAHRALSAW